MAQITIDIDDAVAAELAAVMQQQAEQLARMPAEQRPANVPTTVGQWLQGVLEQNIASLVLGRLQTPEVQAARAAAEEAQRALVRAASGLRAIEVRWE
jgi:hypothetical protein